MPKKFYEIMIDIITLRDRCSEPRDRYSKIKVFEFMRK